MAKDTHDKLFEIALDMQKQLGVVIAEAATHTNQLSSIEKQVLKTNGRVTKSEEDIQILKDNEMFRKGRSAVIGAITGFIMAIVTALAIGLFKKITGL